MQDDVKYYNQPLWISTDTHKTTNQLHMSLSMSKDQYGTRPITFQCRITNFKNRVNNFMTLHYSHILKLMEGYKKFDQQVSNVGVEWKEKIKPITINKKKFMIFMMKTNEYSESVMIAMSARGKDYLDSEKFFMSYNDFKALFDILDNTLKQYAVVSSNIQILSLLEEMTTMTAIGNGKLTDIQRTNLASSQPILPESQEETPDMDSLFASGEINISEEPTVESTVDQNELDNFIKDETPNVVLDEINKAEERNKNKEKTHQAGLDSINDEFTEHVLDNNVLNLEVLIKSCLSEKMPLLKVAELIKSKLGFDEIFVGCQKEEYLSIMYCNTIYLKEMVRRHIQEKVDLPTSVLPVRCNIKDYTAKNRSLMYSMYSYMVCYSLLNLQLKEKSVNSFENKEFYTFILKVITSPFVYSFLDAYKKEDFIQNVINRVKLQLERGAFQKLFESIENKFGYRPTIDINAVSEIAGKTYTVVMDKWKCIDNDNFMQKLSTNKISLLSWGDFIECGFTSIDEVGKFIMLEFNHKKNGEVKLDELSDDLKDTSDLSKFALGKLDLNEKKYDTTNLLRFCEDTLKGDENEEYMRGVLANINAGVHDIDFEHIQWDLFPDDILNAIIDWNPFDDPGVATNYKYYKDKIRTCYLERHTVLTMLKHYSVESNVDDYHGAIKLDSQKEQI